MTPESREAEMGNETCVVSVNSRSAPLVDSLVQDAMLLNLSVERLPNGCTVVDAGIRVVGGLEAGRRIAEICLGGLGRVALTYRETARWPVGVTVYTAAPVLACLGSQYAGWSLNHGEGESAFHALGSGPARSLAAKEPLFEELGYRDQASVGCLVLEVDHPPPVALLHKIAADCGICTSALTVILTPTRSLAGTVQIVARVLEVALHKAHALQFPLGHIADGVGSAPLPPPTPDFVQAMGRTNDAIVFAGCVHLYVRGDEQAARFLAQALPANQSKDYGRPFAEVFKSYDYDFFQIDPMLFSPAEVRVSALDSGMTFHAGKVDEILLEQSFGRKS
jgi:methenyltetrahydromethanopterin cyclohydrolase